MLPAPEPTGCLQLSCGKPYMLMRQTQDVQIVGAKRFEQSWRELGAEAGSAACRKVPSWAALIVGPLQYRRLFRTNPYPMDSSGWLSTT